MATITFYHSLICPRCRVVDLRLSSLLRELPHIEVEKVEFLTHRKAAHHSGVKTIPTLVAGDRQLSGFLPSKKRLRAFLESI